MTGFTPELATPEVDQTQNNKYLTMNNLVVMTQAAFNKTLLSATTGAWNLTEAQFTQYMTFKASGRAAAFDITLPDAVDVTNPERHFLVWNADTTYTATVKALTTPGTTVVLTPGQVALCYRNGVNVVAILGPLGVGGSGPYDLGFFVPGLPTDAGIVLEVKAARAFSLADNFAGSTCKVATNPTSTAVFDVLKNGSSIGSISIATSGVATFNTTGGGASFAINDILSVTAPTPQDATLSDVGVLFLGTRT
jgi:hypothetical protein